MSPRLETRGEFYFNDSGDNSTDTRLEHLVTAKCSFQVCSALRQAPGGHEKQAGQWQNPRNRVNRKNLELG
jgi:hypothetical protein